MAPNPIDLWFGDIHGTKPYKFIGFGDIHVPKPYRFIWFGECATASDRAVPVPINIYTYIYKVW